jgi:hypothetical protein
MKIKSYIMGTLLLIAVLSGFTGIRPGKYNRQVTDISRQIPDSSKRDICKMFI